MIISGDKRPKRDNNKHLFPPALSRERAKSGCEYLCKGLVVARSNLLTAAFVLSGGNPKYAVTEYRPKIIPLAIFIGFLNEAD